MDAYNRGYHEGLAGLPRGDGIRIGNAVFFSDNMLSDAKAASFYGIDWRVNGQDYIAYRGTDVKDVLASSNDIWGGWSIGLGFSAGTQADLAAKFYEQVLAARTSPPSSTSVFAPAPLDIHVTGHSLGGGLPDQVAAHSPV